MLDAALFLEVVGTNLRATTLHINFSIDLRNLQRYFLFALTNIRIKGHIEERVILLGILCNLLRVNCVILGLDILMTLTI